MQSKDELKKIDWSKGVERIDPNYKHLEQFYITSVSVGPNMWHLVDVIDNNAERRWICVYDDWGYPVYDRVKVRRLRNKHEQIKRFISIDKRTGMAVVTTGTLNELCRIMDSAGYDRSVWISREVNYER